MHHIEHPRANHTPVVARRAVIISRAAGRDAFALGRVITANFFTGRQKNLIYFTDNFTITFMRSSSTIQFQELPTIQYSTVGEYIRGYRTILGIPQEELATISGVTRQTIGSIENDEKNSRFALVGKILSYLKSKGAPGIDLYRLSFPIML